MSTSEARAYQAFKSLLDLAPSAQDAELARLATDAPDIHPQVLRLILRDRQEDQLLDRPGAGADELLAHDLLTSMIARGEVAPGAIPDHIGPYRLLGELGRGGMGVVYEAEQDSPKRRVAIKTAHAWLATPALARRFRFEVQALAALRHRAIPRLFEVREEGGTTWMVMELVRGEALDTYAARLPVPQRLRLLIEIADGVAHAHAAGITHRDLKPANIVVSEGHPRILDFGLAAPHDAAVGERPPRSREAPTAASAVSVAPAPPSAVSSGPNSTGPADPATGLRGRDLPLPDEPTQAAGTLAYMAPELLAGDAADHRADIYGLGVILYEVLTGERPPSSHGHSRAELRANKAHLPPPVSRHRGLGRDLDFILEKALHPDPAQRYPDAQTLATDLERYLAGRPVSARRATLAYRLARTLQRQRRPLYAVGLTLLFAALITGTLAFLRARDEAHAHSEREHRAAERLAVLRERGEDAEAEALFAYFVRSPDHTNTRALHDAWLWRGRTMRDRIAASNPIEPIDPHFGEASQEAFAEAFASAVDAPGRDSALLELGHLFHRLEAFDGVRRVLELLKGTHAPRDQVDTLRLLSLAEQRALSNAAQLDHAQARELAPMLDALSRGTPLGVTATTASQMTTWANPSHDETMLIGVLDQPDNVLRVLDTSRREIAVSLDRSGPLRRGPTAGRAAVGEIAHLRLPPDTRYGHNLPRLLKGLETCAIVPRHHGIVHVHCLGDDRSFTEPLELPVPDLHAGIGWRGPDGLELLVGSAGGNRALYHWRRGVLTQLPPEVVGPASDIDSLLRADLDGDGEQEIVVSFGAWRAYDLRILRQTEHGFELRARKRLGIIQQVGLLRRKDATPLIAAVKQNTYPSPNLLGQLTPFGPPPGVYLLELRGDDIVEHQRIPFLSGTRLMPTPHRLVIGDFDGDGLDDFALGSVTQRAEYTMLYRQVVPDRFAGVLIGDMTPLDVVDLGPRQGLLVRTYEDLQGWLLGLGDTPLPPRTSQELPLEELEPPDTDLALEWRRASELDSMGLPTAAARRMEAAARLARSPLAGTEALIRAGELLIKANRPAEASPLLDEVIQDAPPELKRRAYRERARAHLARHELGEAVSDLGQTDLDLDVAGGRAHLMAVAQRTSPPIEVIARGAIDARWHIERPGAITRTGYASQALRLAGARGDGPIATLPVTYGGGAIAIDMTWTVEHLELGAQLGLYLRDGERDVAWFELFGQGGGLVLERHMACGPNVGMSPLAHGQPYHFDRQPERLAIRLGILPTPTGAELFCEVADGARVIIGRSLPVTPPRRGPLTLALIARGDNDGAVTLWSNQLETITLTGLTPNSGGGDRLARALFERDYATAQLSLAGASPWVAADLDVELGDLNAATTRLAPLALEDGFWSSRELLRRLRLSPRTWLSITTPLDRQAALRALTRAWAVGVRYLASERTLSFLALPELAEVGGESPEDLLTLAALLRAGHRMGLSSSAWRHALSLAEREPSAERAARTAELALLAAAHYARIDPDSPRARALFERWRRTVPFPELAFDSLPHDPDAGHLARWLE